MQHLEFLKVYSFDNKKRYGINSDGGYVIAMLENGYDSYISAGVSNEESFSRDFISDYGMNREQCYAFDGTIHDYPYHYTDKIQFFKKNIGPVNSDNQTDLTDILEKHNNVFLKMDIEGGEYGWLLGLDDTNLARFKQIVIEFHGINDDSWGYIYSDKLACFQKLAKTHYLVHAHGNNNALTTNKIPDVIELTYINKNYFQNEPTGNKIPMPIPNLDFRNNTCYDREYNLDFYPFIN